MTCGARMAFILALALGACAVSEAGAATPRSRTPAVRQPAPSRVTRTTIADPHTHHARDVWVYLPAGYVAHGPGYDVLVVFDGSEYREQIPLPRILDTLIAARRIAPTVAVLIDDGGDGARIAELGNVGWFADWLARDLVPWVRAHWNVTRDPHHVTITGSSAGGLAAAFAALVHPETFGNVLSQSGAFWRGAEASNDPPWEWLTGRYAALPKRDVRLLLDVGSTETHGALGGAAPSILDANRHLRDVLVRKGYSVTYTEVPNGVHAPESWRLRLAGDLDTLARRP